MVVIRWVSQKRKEVIGIDFHPKAYVRRKRSYPERTSDSSSEMRPRLSSKKFDAIILSNVLGAYPKRVDFLKNQRSFEYPSKGSHDKQRLAHPIKKEIKGIGVWINPLRQYNFDLSKRARTIWIENKSHSVQFGEIWGNR